MQAYYESHKAPRDFEYTEFVPDQWLPFNAEEAKRFLRKSPNKGKLYSMGPYKQVGKYWFEQTNALGASRWCFCEPDFETIILLIRHNEQSANRKVIKKYADRT